MVDKDARIKELEAELAVAKVCMNDARNEADQLTQALKDCVTALELECGGKCARGINECNARETLERNKEIIERIKC